MIKRADRGFHRADRDGVMDVIAEQTIGAVGDMISMDSNAACVVKRLNSTGAFVLTSTPTIAPGKFDGQELWLVGNPAMPAAVTIQDAATLAGSGIRLSGVNQAHNLRDVTALRWNASVGEWWLSSARVNNL